MQLPVRFVHTCRCTRTIDTHHNCIELSSSSGHDCDKTSMGVDCSNGIGSVSLSSTNRQCNLLYHHVLEYKAHVLEIQQPSQDATKV